jgi:hypothetical protein
MCVWGSTLKIPQMTFLRGGEMTATASGRAREPRFVGNCPSLKKQKPLPPSC